MRESIGQHCFEGRSEPAWPRRRQWLNTFVWPQHEVGERLDLPDMGHGTIHDLAQSRYWLA